MKKKLLYLLLLFGILFCIKINVNAKEISSSDISPRTYIIGKHEFTENITLSTKHIMLASKTIEGDTLDDMIIYYKNPRGKWINGLTGETINVSEKFDLEYVDLVKGLEAPTLASLKSSGSNGHISITREGYYKYLNNIDEISGWELYEKTENGYAKIYEGNEYDYYFDLNNGESKTYIARVYKITSTLDREYSSYSNEITIKGVKLPAPTLTKKSETDDEMIFSFTDEGYYSAPGTTDNIVYWSLNIRNNSGNNYIKELTYGESITEITLSKDDIPYGTNMEIFLIVCSSNDEEEFIQSDESNKIIITKEGLNAPYIYQMSGSWASVNIDMTFSGYYENEAALKEISGWELYEKTENGYTKVYEGTNYNYKQSIEPGTTKTFVARVYKDNVDGTRTYSKYSNEEEVTPLTPYTPTLTSKEDNGKISFSITDEGYYNTNGTKHINGWELYVKSSNGNISLLTSEKPYSYTIDIPYGMKNTYYARVYIEDLDNEKAYSIYSNEIIIDKELPIPTLSNDYSYTEGASLSILNEGFYASSNNKTNIISGWELYEKTEKGYSKLTEGGSSYTYKIQMEAGTSKTFVSRVYRDVNNERLYSDYSNEIKRIIPGTPTLSLISTTATENTLSITKDGYYSDNTKLNEVTKVYYYKVNSNNENELISECDGSTTCKVNIPYGTTEKFNAVVYYKDTNNNEMYSKSSNTLEIISKVPVPTLEGNLAYESYADLVATYSDENVSSTITGYDFYIVEDDLIEVCSGESQNCAYSGLIPQIKKTFVVKAYVLDSDNNKIYSDESNRVEVLREKIVVPEIQITKYKDSTNIIIEPYSNIYSKELVAKSITGIQIYKVENSKYTLLDDFRDSTQTMGYFLEEGETLTLAVRAYLEGDRVYYSEYGMAGITG